MEEYISKSAVVAEIEKRKKEWQYCSSIEAKYKKEECDDILLFLDTLEVKEAIDGIAIPDDGEIWCNLKSFNLKEGNKIKVILIKED